MNISDKTFIVTGAGSGIGKALTLGLLAKGARVAAADRDENALAVLQTEISDASKLSAHTLDVTDREAIERLPEAVIAAHGAVDGIINNAGIIQPFVRTNDLQYDAIERVMNVNFYGTLTMIKTFLPDLLERPEASVVNVSSMGGFLPVPGQGVYGASKAAVKLLSESLFAELQDTAVHVSTVFPGATDTNIAKSSQIKMETPAGSSKSSVSMISPEAAAKIIITGIERDTPLIYTGSDSRSMNLLYRLAPVRATKLIAKKMKSLLQ